MHKCSICYGCMAKVTSDIHHVVSVSSATGGAYTRLHQTEWCHSVMPISVGRRCAMLIHANYGWSMPINAGWMLVYQYRTMLIHSDQCWYTLISTETWCVGVLPRLTRCTCNWIMVMSHKFTLMTLTFDPWPWPSHSTHITSSCMPLPNLETLGPTVQSPKC